MIAAAVSSHPHPHPHQGDHLSHHHLVDHQDHLHSHPQTHHHQTRTGVLRRGRLSTRRMSMSRLGRVTRGRMLGLSSMSSMSQSTRTSSSSRLLLSTVSVISLNLNHFLWDLHFLSCFEQFHPHDNYLNKCILLDKLYSEPGNNKNLELIALGNFLASNNFNNLILESISLLSYREKLFKDRKRWPERDEIGEEIDFIWLNKTKFGMPQLEININEDECENKIEKSHDEKNVVDLMLREIHQWSGYSILTMTIDVSD